MGKKDACRLRRQRRELIIDDTGDAMDGSSVLVRTLDDIVLLFKTEVPVTGRESPKRKRGSTCTPTSQTKTTLQHWFGHVTKIEILSGTTWKRVDKVLIEEAKSNRSKIRFQCLWYSRLHESDPLTYYRHKVSDFKPVTADAFESRVNFTYTDKDRTHHLTQEEWNMMAKLMGEAEVHADVPLSPESDGSIKVITGPKLSSAEKALAKRLEREHSEQNETEKVVHVRTRSRYALRTRVSRLNVTSC